MKTIDGGLLLSKANSSTRDTGLKLVNASGLVFDDYTIRNCYGVYLENVNGCTFGILDLTDVYSMNMRNCKDNRFKVIRVNRSWVGVKLENLCVNNTFDEIYSDYANDLDPALTAPNGDGLMINNENCTDNKFGKVRTNNNTDCGFDNKGVRITVQDFEAHGNLHGMKQWSAGTVIKRYWAIGNKGNGILCISGDALITGANLRDNAGGNIKMGLGGYRDRSKKLTIDGYFDKETIDNHDSISTLNSTMKVGLPPEPVPVPTPVPSPDYKDLYDKLSQSYAGVVADRDRLIQEKNALVMEMSTVTNKLLGFEDKLKQINSISLI